MPPPTAASTLRRIAATAWLLPPGPAAVRLAGRFAGAARAVPTHFRTPMAAHGLSTRLPAPPALRQVVTALRGRLVVANVLGAARLPGSLQVTLRALVRAALAEGGLGAGIAAASAPPAPAGGPGPSALLDAHTARERRALAALGRAMAAHAPALRAGPDGPAAWAALALFEEAAPSVAIVPAGPGDGGDAAAGRTPDRARAEVALRYRVVCVLGDGAPPAGWAPLDGAVAAAPAIPWGLGPLGADGGAVDASWFRCRQLVPDAWLAAQADASSLALWARATGRDGGPARYWFAESWERFLEAERRVGFVSPDDVWRSRRDEGPPADALAAASPYAPLTPAVERGVGVPPGYALVQTVGTLELAIVRA